MGYSASNFIGTYLTSSKTLRIFDSSVNIAFTFSVCAYQKSSVIGKNLNIVLEDNTKQYSLDFSSTSEARQALLTLKIAIDTLRVNCASAPGSGGGGGGENDPLVVIPITYLQYKTLQSTNSLIALQWYDVTDTTGVIIPTGQTIRLQALSSSDNHPQGIILTTHKPRVSFDSVSDSIISYEDPTQKLLFINTQILSQNFDTNTTNISIKNNSTINVTNSHYLELENNSSLRGTGLTNIRLTNNSSININNATDLEIDNIQKDFTTLGYSLSNVFINPTDSTGKLGQEPLPSAISTNLYAYSNYVDQVFTISSNNTNYTITLWNEIPQANASFRIKYTGSGINNVISINNSSSTLLFSLKDINKDNWVVFTFNKGTGLFEFTRLESGNKNASIVQTVYTATVTSTDQTVFALPVGPQLASNLQMFVNGQKEKYGSDFTYDSSSQSAIYLDRDYILNIGDEVEFIIY